MRRDDRRRSPQGRGGRDSTRANMLVVFLPLACYANELRELINYRQWLSNVKCLRRLLFVRRYVCVQNQD